MIGSDSSAEVGNEATTKAYADIRFTMSKLCKTVETPRA